MSEYLPKTAGTMDIFNKSLSIVVFNPTPAPLRIRITRSNTIINHVNIYS